MQGIKFYIMAVILFLSFLPLPLVSLDPGKSIDQYPFKTFSIKDGIQGSGMSCIGEDMKGNLRIGSEEGYLNRFKIEEAKNLLFAPGENDHSILDIAYEVGFNSKAVFNRAFRKFTGMTPSQFKKNNINGSTNEQ